jgi:hypothetical protein
MPVGETGSRRTCLPPDLAQAMESSCAMHAFDASLAGSIVACRFGWRYNAEDLPRDARARHVSRKKTPAIG